MARWVLEYSLKTKKRRAAVVEQLPKALSEKKCGGTGRRTALLWNKIAGTLIPALLLMAPARLNFPIQANGLPTPAAI